MTDIDVEFKVYRPIISKLVDGICQSISRSVIRTLQRMDASEAIGDCGMESLWDEICILMDEGDSDSHIWDAYMMTVDQVIEGVLMKKNLPLWQLNAIWLQTQAGNDWIDELSKNCAEFDGLIMCEEDVVQYVRNDYVCRAAIDWSNQRLRNYYDSRHEPDYEGD